MTPNVRRRRRHPLASLFLLLVAVAPGCAGEERGAGGAGAGAGADADADADTDTDSDTDADTEVDAVSGATPLVASARLTEGHEGFARADCASCHVDVHGAAGYAAPDCVTCHGTNGAPFRPAGHADTGCADEACHPSAHPSLGLEAPSDCRA